MMRTLPAYLEGEDLMVFTFVFRNLMILLKNKKDIEDIKNLEPKTHNDNIALIYYLLSIIKAISKGHTLGKRVYGIGYLTLLKFILLYLIRDIC